MANSVADKLKIKTGDILLSLNAPPNFKRDLGELPEDVSVTLMGKTYNQIHWFVMNKAQLEKELSKVLKMLQSEILVWVYYPKGTGDMQTDLTRDKGWDSLLSETKKLTWVSLISFDDNWSAFGFRAGGATTVTGLGVVLTVLVSLLISLASGFITVGLRIFGASFSVASSSISFALSTSAFTGEAGVKAISSRGAGSPGFIG